MPNEISKEKALTKDSTFTRSHLKTKILKYKLLSHECAICKIGPEWNGKTLTLQVDHINGINTDHRLENLRFLCPNCHSQTPTYAGANANNRKEAETFRCTQCDNYRSRVSESGLCIRCKSTSDKLIWPDDTVLQEMLRESNINQVAKKLGVSYPGLKKRLQKHKLI